MRRTLPFSLERYAFCALTFMAFMLPCAADPPAKSPSDITTTATSSSTIEAPRANSNPDSGTPVIAPPRLQRPLLPPPPLVTLMQPRGRGYTKAALAWRVQAQALARESSHKPDAPERTYDATYGATISALDGALRSAGYKLFATSMAAGHFLAKQLPADPSRSFSRNVIVVVKRVDRQTTSVRIAIEGARRETRLQRLASDMLESIEANISSRNAL